MGKLDDIIHSLWCRAVVTGFQTGKGVDKDEAGYKQQIKGLMLELIGDAYQEYINQGDKERSYNFYLGKKVEEL